MEIIKKIKIFGTKKLMVFLLLFLVFMSFVSPKAISEDSAGNIIISLSILENYQKINAGEEILLESEILLLGSEKSGISDVVLEYSIKDKNSLVINKVVETKSGEFRIDDVKHLLIPEDLPPGVYTVCLKAVWQNISKETALNFEVVGALLKSNYADPEEVSQINIHNTIIEILIILIVILLIIMLLIQHKKFKRIEKKIKIITVKDLKNGKLLR